MDNPAGLSDERYAQQRGRYLGRTLELRAPVAEAVAWSELGYSSSGIAKKLDTTQDTVEKYLEQAMVLYGFEILEWHPEPDKEPPDYERVEPGYHRQRVEEDQKKWIELVDRNRERLPQDWVHNVLEAAQEDGITPSI